MSKANRGFTLIEVMVVIAIISILATVAFVGVRPASEQSRDTQRQADLRDVQNALELYENRYGRYPEGCNAAGTWSGQPGSSHACTSGQPYILGSVGNTDPADDRPFAEFMVNLPTDPKEVSGSEGYLYTTNADGTVYKFIAKNTVESEVVDYDHPFKSCDVSYNFVVEAGSPSMTDHVQACDPPNGITDNTLDGCDIAICDRLYTTNLYGGGGGNPPPYCRDDNNQFRSSYGVWGGLAEITNSFFFEPGREEQLRVRTERETEEIICSMG